MNTQQDGWLKFKRTNVGREMGQTGTFTYYWWDNEMVQPLYKTVSQKMKYRVTKLCSSFTAVYTQEKWNYVYTKYTDIHSGIVHHSQKVETTQESSTDEWIIKIMVCLYNTLMFSNKKEWTTETSFYMDKPWKNAKWKKIDTKHILLWFQLSEVSRIGKSIETVN